MLFLLVSKEAIKKLTGFAWKVLETPIHVCRGASILYFNLPIFCCPPQGYLNLQVRIIKTVNIVKGCILSHFYKLIRVFISLQNTCWIFICGKNFQIHGVHIPRKCIESKHFWSSYHLTLGRVKSLIPLGSIFLKICFSQQRKGVEETMICFTKIQSENMKVTWSIRLFMFCTICNFLCIYSL